MVLTSGLMSVMRGKKGLMELALWRVPNAKPSFFQVRVPLPLNLATYPPGLAAPPAISEVGPSWSVPAT